MGLDPTGLPHQMDQSQWPAMKEKFAAVFATKTRDEWSNIFDGTDACVAPVLALGEVHEHAHNRERSLLIGDAAGKLEPAPAPRLSRTPGSVRRPIPTVGQHTDEVLGEYGFAAAEISGLKEGSIVG